MGSLAPFKRTSSSFSRLQTLFIVLASSCIQGANFRRIPFEVWGSSEDSEHQFIIHLDAQGVNCMMVSSSKGVEVSIAQILMLRREKRTGVAIRRIFFPVMSVLSGVLLPVLRSNDSCRQHPSPRWIPC